MIFNLVACSTYKITPDKEISNYDNSSQEISVTKDNEFPEGNHCFEPMLYVLSLGLIPTHCVNTYSIQNNDDILGKVKVTEIQGWVALLIAPFPKWQFGYSLNPENEIKELVNAKK